jgi:FkbM family methyltransferase
MFRRPWRTMSADPAPSTQAVLWAYRLLLGREPESSAIVAQHADAGPATWQFIRERFLHSEEFAAALRPFQLSLTRRYPSQDLLAPFADGSDAVGEPGFFRDVFGVRTRCAFMPESMAGFSGQVGRPDRVPVLGLHDQPELEYFLRSIDVARGTLTVVELGAGWGPWIVLGAVLGRRRGLDVRLIAVEGAEEHVDFMREHLWDNGIEPGDHRLLHAVVGACDGLAHFPRLAAAREEWGAEAQFNAAPTSATLTSVTNDVAALPCVSIATLLDELDRVDVLHCDIQGAEADAIRAGIDVLTARVRRIIVATHRRAIEAELHHLLFDRGWHLEADQACQMIDVGDRLVLIQDGVQVWRNDRLAERPLAH